MNPNLDADDDEILLPAVDSAKAMRGIFAHRKGEQREDERQVAVFWQSRGLGVELLESNPRELFSRLPDMRLSRDGEAFAYCEVKTLWRNTSEIRILHEERTVEERVEASKMGTEERLTTDVIAAIRQLLYANPDHRLLNIVVLVNHDREAIRAHLAHVLNRRLTYKELLSQDWRAARTNEEVERFRVGVDFCLWADPTEGGELKIEACYLLNPSLRSFAEEITGMRGDKLISLEPAA